MATVRPYAMTGIDKDGMTISLVAVESKVVANSTQSDHMLKDAVVTITVVYITPTEAEELIMELHKQVAQAMKPVEGWSKTVER